MSNDLRPQIVALIPALRAAAYVRTRSKSEADDLVQETLIRALKYLGSFQSGTNLKSWLYKIMQNCQRHEYQKQRHTVQDVEGQFAACLTIPPSQEWRLQCTEVATALLKLTPDARGALLMIASEDISYEEAAVRFDCAVGTLKSRVNRARERLAELTDRTPEPRKDHKKRKPVGQSSVASAVAAFREQTLQIAGSNSPVASADV